MYLPGRGGNIRFALNVGGNTKWIHDADTIESKYSPGSLIYHIEDPLLGTGSLDLEAICSYQTEGFLIRCFPKNVPENSQLICVFGGVNGERGKRDGDIGTEAIPISEWFQLKPEFCRNNQIVLQSEISQCSIQDPKGQIIATFSDKSELMIVPAAVWEESDLLLDTQTGSIEFPLAVAITELQNGQAVYFGWQKRPNSKTDQAELADYLAVRDTSNETRAYNENSSFNLWTSDSLENQFQEENTIRISRSEQIKIQTPDPFLNTAVKALCIGADATWDDPQQVVMHGAIAWRSKLLGWRGPYAMDALGWHDRARAHLSYWAQQQDTSSIPEKFPGADEKRNLARMEAALHSNGALSHSHYDMNLVYIDALFRHLRWTGDLEFARAVWPMIQRHLAWEKRLFRRNFGTAENPLPLYEAYAAIWASDELSYNGGGVSYSSAYNAFHNREAARLAKLLGEDPIPFESEAEAIENAMHQLLWVSSKNESHYAEYKDWMGLKQVHSSAGVWSVYHAIDSEITSQSEAYAMTRYIDKNIPSHPIYYPEIDPNENLRVIATSHWFPYTWSVNNVVMGENLHTALAYWQAGRPECAWRLAKGAIIASMYAGICPGNVGSMNFLDAYRGESQRDFADGAGVMSRMLIEGLFGIKPDVINHRLMIRPGFPDSWDSASLKHHSIDLEYWKYKEGWHTIDIVTHFKNPVQLILKLPLSVDSESIRVNNNEPSSIQEIGGNGVGFVEATFPESQVFHIVYRQSEVSNSDEPPSSFSAENSVCVEPVDWKQQIDPSIAVPIDLAPYFNAKVSEIFQQEYHYPRSPFTSLAIPKQGIGGWAGAWNAHFEVDDSGLRKVSALNNGRLILPNGVPMRTPFQKESPNILFTSQWNNFPDSLTIPLSGKAICAYLMLAGSTNWMQSHFDNGVITFHYEDGTQTQLRLHNPTTWWPIDQDYFINNFQFQLSEPYPLRLDLKSGQTRTISNKATTQIASSIEGGSSTILKCTLDVDKRLKSIEIKALSNEVVIGLMALTLITP